MSEIILASASPRRREIMENMGISFSILTADVDESTIDTCVMPEIYVQQLALLKAAAAAKKIIHNKKAIVISADTVVVHDGKILGKPKDEADAVNTLKSLSGDVHRVYTGFCVLRVSDAYTVCQNVCTKVRMRQLTDEKIERYVRTGECMDKAGSYAVQGLGAMLVDKIEGDYFNVVGLPAGELAQVLEEDFGYKII